jgi:hypothetical protein
MTPIAFDRVTKELAKREGKLEMQLHLLGLGMIAVDTWAWLNGGRSQNGDQSLDVIIVAYGGNRIYYVNVEHVAFVSVQAKSARELLKHPRRVKP